MTREEMHVKLNPEASIFKAELIDMMYYAQNSRICEGCKYAVEFKSESYECSKLGYADSEGCESYINVDKTFSCNKWEVK